MTTPTTTGLGTERLRSSPVEASPETLGSVLDGRATVGALDTLFYELRR